MINLANEVFGFNGWSSAIKNVQIDFVDENTTNGKITLGISTIVRVTLRDGTYHEDIGYGHIENCKGKAAAFEKAKKEAATDAMKRALRNFGNVLGNCLYDKDYLQKVTKVKIAPSKWDAENLHRHPDYAPIKREAIADSEQRRDTDKASVARRTISAQSGASYGSVEFEEDFGGDPFDETGPDEVRIEGTGGGIDSPATNARTPVSHAGQQRPGQPQTHSMPATRPQSVAQGQAPPRPPGPPRAPNNAAHLQPVKQFQGHETSNASMPAQDAAQKQPDTSDARTNSSSNTTTELPPPREPPPGIPEGFVTGRGAEMLNQPPSSRPPNSAIAFNPHVEASSIRRTHGVNPGKSVPIMRSALNISSAASDTQQTPGAPPGQLAHPQPLPSNGLNGAAVSGRVNFVNPSADTTRRVGMPPSAASHTMQNRSAYRPPTPVKRAPLSDVSNLQQMDGAGEAKKAKLEHADVPAEAMQDGTTTADAAST